MKNKNFAEIETISITKGTCIKCTNNDNGQRYSFRDPSKTKFVFEAKYQNPSCTRLLTVLKIGLENFYVSDTYKIYQSKRCHEKVALTDRSAVTDTRPTLEGCWRIYDSAGTICAGSRNYPQAIAISDAESARLPVRRERAGRRPSRPQARRRGNGSYSRLLDRR